MHKATRLVKAGLKILHCKQRASPLSRRPHAPLRHCQVLGYKLCALAGMEWRASLGYSSMDGCLSASGLNSCHPPAFSGSLSVPSNCVSFYQAAAMPFGGSFACQGNGAERLVVRDWYTSDKEPDKMQASNTETDDMQASYPDTRAITSAVARLQNCRSAIPNLQNASQ